MFDLYLTGPFVPFTMALALLFGLLVLELVLALLGGTLFGFGADADFDLDLDAPDLGDLDIDFGEADPSAFEFAEAAPEVPTAEANYPGLASWLGIGRVPTLIWLAALLLGFGVAGLSLQSLLNGLFGLALPAFVAFFPAAFAGIWFAGSFGAVFARLLPKTETTALSNRHLGRRVGVVTQGISRRGKPTEVKVFDRFGNAHYLRGEPLRDEIEIPAGTRVLVLRHRFDQGYRLVPVDAETA